MALSKVDGIAKVDVTLKRGVAHITLSDGNAVTLAAVRRIVKEAGYTTGDAVVTASGHVASTAGVQQFTVEGTREQFRLEAGDAAREPLRAAAASPQAVIITGTATPPASGTKAPETLRISTIAASK